MPEPNPQESPNHELIDKLRHLVGSFIWLFQGTRPDLATITSMVARYQNLDTQYDMPKERRPEALSLTALSPITSII